MGKKITLADIGKLLKGDKTKGDTSYWGVVQSVNTTGGEVTSYNVSLGGDTGTVKCRKLAGAKVNDTVLVTLRSTGEAVVVGTKNGDTDASDAQTTADTAQQTADTAQGTAIAAQQTANNASSSANTAYNKAVGVENHFWYDGDGAHVALVKPIGSSTLNTLINSGGMAILKGNTELAKFTDTLIELGKNSNTATIKLCGGSGIIKYISGTGGGVYFGLPIANNYRSGVTARGSEVEITSGDFTDGSWLNVADSRISMYSADGGLTINGKTMADFVIEQGTSSSWNYRKWKSGKKECWRTVTQSITKAGGSGPYYGDGSTVSFPSSFFSSAPMVQMSNSGSADGWLGTTSAATSSATGQPRLYRLASWTGSKSVTLSIYAIGS